MINERGQGLIEAMLATAVVLSLVYALLNLSALAMKNSSFASERAVAMRYLQEGLEILRANRDEVGGWSTIQGLPLGVTPDDALCFNSANPTNLDNSLGELTNCYEENEEFKSNRLLDTRYERTFTVETVKRAGTENCPNGCSACGTVDPSGTVDDCSRKVTVQVAWPGVTTACSSHPILGTSGRKYCVISSTILTNWK